MSRAATSANSSAKSGACTAAQVLAESQVEAVMDDLDCDLMIRAGYAAA